MRTVVRLLDPHTGQLLREHLRQQRGRHRIQERTARANTAVQSPTAAPRRRAGPHVGAFCQCHAPANGRDCRAPHPWACCRWRKKYGVAATDDACAAALELGCLSNTASCAATWNASACR